MTPRRSAKREKKPTEEAPLEERSPESHSSPRALHYFYLNLAFWGFLVLQTIVLRRSLGSGQMVYLFSALLGLGFAAACLFDYFWLRFKR